MTVRRIQRLGVHHLRLDRHPQPRARHLDLPYVQLRSQSTGQHFLLFIDQGDNLPEPRPGGFNRYGLSQGGSVPWF